MGTKASACDHLHMDQLRSATSNFCRSLIAASTMGLLGLLGCGDEDEPAVDAASEADAPMAPREPLSIRPGEGIGPVNVGDRWSDIVGVLDGARPVAFNRLGLVAVPRMGLEVVLASSMDSMVSDDAYVMGIGALDGGTFEGPIEPGATEAELLESLGEADFEAGGVRFYTEGLSVELGEDGTVSKVAVIAPFTIDETAPRMEMAL